MTRDDLERFLGRVGASSLGEYLGKTGRDEAIIALEERIGWAVAHRDDPEHQEVSEFLARNVDALRGVLDEGEEAWWERTATSSRIRKTDRTDPGAWQDLAPFTTPKTAPGRPSPTIVADEDSLDAPRKTMRKGRNAVEPPREARTWSDEVPVDPDETDPIGFTAVPLSVADRERDQRLASTPAPVGPREQAVTFGFHEDDVDADEVTDPSGPTPVLPEPPRPPPPQALAFPEPAGPSRASAAAILVGGLILLFGIVALLVVVARLGRYQGETFAKEAWREAHVTSTTTALPPEPGAPEPDPAPGVEPAPGPAAPTDPGTHPDNRRIAMPVRDPGFLPPNPAPEPVDGSLARTTWVGTGGTGPLTLHLDAQDGAVIEGRVVTVVGGMNVTTPVTGTWDAGSKALALQGGGLALAGTLDGGSARGTWTPDGTTRQWLLAKQ